jgi:hypothetical protein
VNGDLNPDSDLKLLLPQPPAAAPTELRAAVLQQVTAELSRKRERSVTRCWALGAACLLLIGVFANVGVLKYEEQQYQAICGPPPVPRPTRELFQAVAEVADQETATQLQEQWLAMRTRKTHDPNEIARLYDTQFRLLSDELNWNE